MRTGLSAPLARRAPVILVAAVALVASSPAWSQRPEDQVKLYPSDPQAGAKFGSVVALDPSEAAGARTLTAIVTAPYGSVGGTEYVGAAYIFQRNALGVWSQTAKLTANDGRFMDLLGSSVAIEGGTAVLGARMWFVNAAGDDLAGAAYVFTANGGNWSQRAKLLPSNSAALDHFGASVALSGDTLAISAPRTAYGAAGSVYIFTRNSAGDWTESVELSHDEDPFLVRGFGSDVALSPDTLLVGVPGYYHSGESSYGAVYVFGRDGSGTWTEEARLLPPTESSTQWNSFGRSVALWGERAVISATYSAYVFERNASGAWQMEAELIPSCAPSVGGSVAIRGDVLIFGSRDDDSLGYDAGAACIFRPNFRGDWREVAKLLANDGVTYDSFGQSVALLSDSILVGSPRRDDYGSDSGAAYVFGLKSATQQLLSFDLLESIQKFERFQHCLNWPSGVGVGLPERCPSLAGCPQCRYRFARTGDRPLVPDYVATLYTEMAPVFEPGDQREQSRDLITRLASAFGKVPTGLNYDEKLKTQVVSHLRSARRTTLDPSLLASAINAIEFDAADLPRGTPVRVEAGRYVTADFVDAARIAFHELESPGLVSLNIENGLPAPAPGYTSSWPVSRYDFNFEGNLTKDGYIDLTFYVAGLNFDSDLSALRVLEWDGSAYKDVTTYMDIRRGVISGRTDRLRTYVVASRDDTRD